MAQSPPGGGMAVAKCSAASQPGGERRGDEDVPGHGAQPRRGGYDGHGIARDRHHLVPALEESREYRATEHAGGADDGDSHQGSPWLSRERTAPRITNRHG